jgi:hypothetical protein
LNLFQIDENVVHLPSECKAFEFRGGEAENQSNTGHEFGGFLVDRAQKKKTTNKKSKKIWIEKMHELDFFSCANY